MSARERVRKHVRELTRALGGGPSVRELKVTSACANSRSHQRAQTQGSISTSPLVKYSPKLCVGRGREWDGDGVTLSGGMAIAERGRVRLLWCPRAKETATAMPLTKPPCC